jgi:hypothetical protein
VADPPETSLHEPSVHLPPRESGVPTKPSLSALHRCVRGRQGKKAGQSRQRSSQPFVRPPIIHYSLFTTPQPLYSTYPYCSLLLAVRSHYSTAYCTETALPLHPQSLILASASAARRTPITPSPPLSLQVTDHLPSHAFETSAVVISQVRYYPVATCPVEHQPRHTEETRRRTWTGTLAQALPLSCARYGLELLGGRAAHFIRPFRTIPVPTGRNPYPLE